MRSTAPDRRLVAALAVIVRSSTDLRHLTAAVRTAALGVTRHLAPAAFPAGNDRSPGVERGAQGGHPRARRPGEPP